MRKIRKRVFAAVLAAALLFTMPGMASYAEAEGAQTKDISGSVTVQAEDDAAEETEAETEVIQESETEDSDMDKLEAGEDDTEDTETDDKEPAEAETVPAQKEDVKECTCGTLCTQDSINGDCPVCGGEDADISLCKGEKTENSSEEKKEDAGQEDTSAQDDSANLCAHHKEHTEDCGYSPASEDGEGSPCTYDCRICPIEDLIAALPGEVTEDNAKEVRAQLDGILNLYRELTVEEQEQIDISHCLELQEALDAANAPAPVDTFSGLTIDTVGGSVTQDENKQIVLSGGGTYTISGTWTDELTGATSGSEKYAILVKTSGTYNITLSNATIETSSSSRGAFSIEAGASVNLTLTGENKLTSGKYCAGLHVPQGASLTIGGDGKLSSTGGMAGIGGGNYETNGAITIKSGEIEASSNKEDGEGNGAGIGGGYTYGSSYRNIVGDEIRIEGGTIAATGGGKSAGIGGGYTGVNAPITITGGTITATGGTDGAGIGAGGGSSSITSTSDIFIGGTAKVTANGSDGEKGIGAGYQGAAGNITIDGNADVTANGIGHSVAGASTKSGTLIVSGSARIESTSDIVIGNFTCNDSPWVESTGIQVNSKNSRNGGIVFVGNAGTVYGSQTITKDYELASGMTLEVPSGASLTIPFGINLTGDGTLSGSGTFKTGNITADMISVPEDWSYTGEDLSEQIKGAVSLSGSAMICGQTFYADTTGWELSVTKVSDLKYTATYTHTGGQPVSKDVTIAQAQTTLSGVIAYKADGTTPANTFGVDETFVVKAAAFPANNAIMAADFTEPTGKQMALYVNGVQVSAPVSAGTDGTYTMTASASDVLALGQVEPNGTAITLTAKFVGDSSMADAAATVAVNISASVKVEIGNDTTYYGGIDAAWTAAKGSTATVTLLDHVTASGILTVDNGSAVTFDGGNYTLTSAAGPVIQVNQGCILKFVGGTVHSIFPGSSACYGIDVRGMLEMTGGAVTMDDMFYSSAVSTYGSGSEATISGGELFGSRGVSVDGGSTVTIKNGKISGGLNALYVNGGTATVEGGIFTGSDSYSYGLTLDSGSVVLRGGTFTGGESAVKGNNSSDVSALLDKSKQPNTYYAYFLGGQPVNLNTLADAKSLPSGTYAVQECKHDTSVCEYQHIDSTQTHTLTCLACGYTSTAEDCSYGTEYQHDDTNHWKICTVCQGTTTPEAHYLRVTADEPVNGVTQNREACDYCDFTKNPFTVTVTVPSGLTYGNTVGIKPSYTISTEKTFNVVQLILEDGKGNVEYMTGDTLPDNLSAGSYKLYLSGGVLDNPEPVFKGRAYFTVAPAPLNENMVTLSPESATYNGMEQKPTITVKQGDTTLAEGTDYDVTYSTTDFTNAGTITVTITGKGNYTGTVETAYTIKKAPLTITASSQTITYGGSITQGADNVSAAGLCSGDSLDRITLTTSTANVPGGNITPSAAGIKNSGGKDVTGNYEITYKDGSLTINKADAEITVGADTYNKTFGDAVFTLDVTDNNTEADVQYEVTAGADVISVSNGTVTIKNAGAAAITVSLPASTNYNAAASKTITVNVAQKGGYAVAEQNRSYLYSRENTGSIDLAALLPKDCGTVTYGTPVTSGDVTYSVAPAVNDGKLSYTLNSGNINDEGTITVTVATRNYTDITITVKVKLTDRIPVSLKTGAKVTLKDNVLTYGEPLSKLVFNEAEFVGDDGNTVAGTLAWKAAAATPNAGTISAVWVFTPADTAYISVDGTATITVNQATPTVSETPELADRVYNPSIALKDDDLSSVTVTGVDGKILEGKWSWQSADIVPTVNNSGYVAVFAPKDTTNYGTVTRMVTVNVTKATPYIAELPAAAAITYGETLKDSLLSGGTAVYGDGAGQEGNKAGNTETVAGAFTWKEPSTKPAAADRNAEYTIVFTPSDTANYNSVEAKVKLTVNKAQNAPNMPGSAMSVSNSIEKVGSVPLPAGWEWQTSDKDTVLEAGVAVSAVAVYTGADKGNYENETVTVAITRSSCDHVAGDVLYTGEGEKVPTCTEDGLGHKECTMCGAMMESGIVVGALKHTGGTATCSQEKVCTRCNRPYGGTDSSRHGDTEVRGFVAATCTAGGCTGDTYCKDCGAKAGAGNVTPALGHDYTSRVTKEPTTEGEGTRTYTCIRCGDQYTKSMPRLPGDDTTKPGSGQPGDTEPGNGSTEETGPDTGIPFIKGEDGKIGWDVIRTEEEQAKEGSVINIDMNGTTVVPGDIFDRLKGRDITITFDMGSDIIWSVDGKSVTRYASRDKAGDIDFDLKTGVNAIPVDIVNNITGESYSIQISLAHEGEFGFTAVLSINLGKENAGYTASLYYYNEGTGELEFICADEVAEDGTASLAFTHASDYVIAINGDEGESGITESAQPESTEGTAGSNTTAQESLRTGQARSHWWPIVVGVLVIIMGICVFFLVRKRKEEKK